METFRKCTKCGRELPVSQFWKDSRGKDGYRSSCIECDKRRMAQYRDEHREEINRIVRAYAATHKKEKSEYRKKYYEKHKDELCAKERLRGKIKKEEILARRKEYVRLHKEDIKKSTEARNKEMGVNMGNNYSKIKRKAIKMGLWEEGCSVHHWSYQYIEQAILMNKESHTFLHRFIARNRGDKFFSYNGERLLTLEQSLDVYREILSKNGLNVKMQVVL